MVWGTFYRENADLANFLKLVPECPGPVECGGGVNRYLGNAQMQSTGTIMGLPLIASHTLADRKLVMVPLDGVFLFF